MQKYQRKHSRIEIKRKSFNLSIYFYIFNLRFFFRKYFSLSSFNSLEDQTAWNFNNKSLRLECKWICVMSTKERKNTSTCLKRQKERPNIGFLLQDVKGYHNGNICNFLKCHFILFIFFVRKIRFRDEIQFTL